LLGEGLPLAVTNEAYQRVLGATRVVPEGKFTTSVGPAALQAQFDSTGRSKSFQLLVIVGPVPNVEEASQSILSEFDVSVREVTDTRGRNLLDESALKEAAFSLHLEAEPADAFPSDKPRPSLEVTGYDLPGQPDLSYGQRTIPLREPVASHEIRRISGSLRLQLPLGITTIVLAGSNLNKTTTKYQISGGVVPDDSKQVRFSVTRGAELYLDQVAVSAEGNVLAPWLSVRSGVSELHMKHGYTKKVAAVRIAMADTFATFEKSFSLSP